MPDFFEHAFMGQALWVWCVFFAVIAAMLVFDLGVLHKDQKKISLRESLIMSCAYISIGLLFNLWIYYKMGASHAADYITGFLIEKSLSLDNIFVIALIFSSFRIPQKYQHRVLFWGILGAIVLRGLMIGLGSALIAHFEWILYVFSAFLILTGAKLLFSKEMVEDMEIPHNPFIVFLKKHIRLTHTLEGEHFLICQPHPKTGKLVLYATPLLLALISVEMADVLFAVDSIPAIFTITTEPYVIYTSNIFAILGLRALYFLLAAVLHKFEYMKYALALVLIFIGTKMFIADLAGLEKFPSFLSLLITLLLLSSGVMLSLLKTKRSS